MHVSVSWRTALRLGLATVVTAALLVATVAAGHPESAVPVQKKDPVAAAGAELPKGAIVRLGSSRFRHDGRSMSEVVFSPDGKQLAAGDTLGVSVFEVQSGKLLYRFPCPPGHMARVVRFLADGKRLAIGSADWQRTAELTLMDLGNGKQVGASSFNGKGQILVIDVTDDGKRALVEERFSKVFLWDIAAARQIWAIDHPEAAFTMPFTADGKSFALTIGHRAELRDSETGKWAAQYPSLGNKFGATYSAATMSPNGKLTCASHDGQAVAILDVRREKTVRQFKPEHRVGQLLVSPDGKYLVGLGEMGTLVWDTTAAKADAGPVARLPGAAHGGFSKDCKMLALDDLGFISLWQVGAWKLLPQSADPASPVQSVRFAPDGKQVLGYTRQGWLRWPLNGGPASRISDESRVYQSRVYDGGVAHISADGRVAADILHEPGAKYGTGKYTVRITDLATGKASRIDVDQDAWSDDQAPDPLTVSLDGRFVSTNLGGSAFVTWSATTGQEVLRRKSTVNGRSLLGAALARDGKSVARSVTGVWSDRVDRFQLGPRYSAVYVTDHTAKREFPLDPLPWSIYSGGVQFSEDGSKLVVEGRFDADRHKDTVAVWDVRSGRRLMLWHRQDGGLKSAQLSPDGRSMTIGDKAGKLAVIEIASGRERAAYRHGGFILSAAFSADGTKVVASSPEAPVFVWDLLGPAHQWDPNKADAIWADLASTDASKAFAAMRGLRANPTAGVALLKDHVRSPTVPPAAKIAAWLKQLDSSDFAERAEADRTLTAVADLIQPDLDAARKGAGLEVVRRLDRIRSSATTPTPERIRMVRVCEVLEGIGSTQASKLLESLAGGPAGSRLTTEARESLARLAR